MQAADAGIEATEQIRAQFKGKTREEALQFLKTNLKDLRSPATFKNLQKVLQSSSPEDLQKLLKQKHKSLSIEDTINLARILTDDKIDEKLPKYLDDKVKSIAKTKDSAQKTGSKDLNDKKPASALESFKKVIDLGRKNKNHKGDDKKSKPSGKTGPK
jgi:uncharacterized protein YydD (DUF2326 family)